MFCNDNKNWWFWQVNEIGFNKTVNVLNLMLKGCQKVDMLLGGFKSHCCWFDFYEELSICSSPSTNMSIKSKKEKILQDQFIDNLLIKYCHIQLYIQLYTAGLGL